MMTILLSYERIGSSKNLARDSLRKADSMSLKSLVNAPSPVITFSLMREAGALRTWFSNEVRSYCRGYT